jgi:hypothetical protein
MALAVGYRSMGQLAEAIPLFERNLADAPQALADDHPLLAVIRLKTPPDYGAAAERGSKPASWFPNPLTA